MDAQAPPMIVEIQTTVKHDLKAELIEHVARLLCRADGKDPDHDWRMGDGTMLSVAVPYPDNLEWARYKSKAEERLRELFK
jgi:hypothetical protein